MQTHALIAVLFVCALIIIALYLIHNKDEEDRQEFNALKLPDPEDRGWDYTGSDLAHGPIKICTAQATPGKAYILFDGVWVFPDRKGQSEAAYKYYRKIIEAIPMRNTIKAQEALKNYVQSKS